MKPGYMPRRACEMSDSHAVYADIGSGILLSSIHIERRIPRLAIYAYTRLQSRVHQYRLQNFDEQVVHEISFRLHIGRLRSFGQHVISSV